MKKIVNTRVTNTKNSTIAKIESKILTGYIVKVYSRLHTTRSAIFLSGDRSNEDNMP